MMVQFFSLDKVRVIVTNLFILFSCTFGICQSADPFAKNFKNPDDDYKPATWMHGMSGNMSKLGMTKDLEAIKKVGIGKVLLFNITQGIPHGPIKYASKDHFDILQHAIAESDRLGLEFGTHNCDGWTSSGGPWVTPENSMKRVVWTKQIIDGGKSTLQLKQPTRIAGLYKDISVLAYPSLDSELEDMASFPKLSSSDPTFPIEKIFSDVESNEYHKLKFNADKKAFINFDYPTKRNIRSVTLSTSDRNVEVSLEKSDDGVNYNKVRDLLKVRLGKGEWAISDNFPAIRAKHFRLSFNSECNIRRVQFTSEHLLQNYLSAISMARTEGDGLQTGYAPSKGDIIDPKIILYFGTPNYDQTILLDLPKGIKWTVMRFGYTSTGAVNSPASNEGRGLEVDKLDKRPLEIHFEKFIGKIADAANKNGNQSFKYSEIDSYEMGGQNWTNALRDEILKRKQFDILKYMPIFAGKYVESEKSTKAILNDLRDVISQLMVENYYGHFQTLCNERGLKSYVEPYGFGPFNFLDAAGKSDLTMGEFWMGRPINQVKAAVDGAYIYGKKIISAESFTSTTEINWAGYPGLAKTSGDAAWVAGINEFMFHRFVHQPNTHVAPGMTMNRWGFHFDRTQTWWENAGKAWFEYMRRGQYLLRQGNISADILAFVGDEAVNSTLGRSDFKPSLPSSINYTSVNADVLINRIKSQNGNMILPEGTIFSILYLHNTKTISLKSLEKIVSLAEQGVKIIGVLPNELIGYVNSEEDQRRFQILTKKLASFIMPVNSWSEFINANLGGLDLADGGRQDLEYIHRKDIDKDIYFFYNKDSVEQKYDLSFRVSGKIPELFNAMDGSTTQVDNFNQNGGRTSFSLALKGGESIFVVFRQNVISTVKSTTKKVLSQSTEIKSNWKFNLPGENPINIQNLEDWSLSKDENLKYFAGTATYHNEIKISKKTLSKDRQIILSLGDVKISAEVFVNNQPVATLWFPPFQTDITPYLKKGKNSIQIKVTNQWTNKLIGDERYNRDQFKGYKLNNGNDVRDNMVDWYVNNEPLPAGPRTTFSTADFVEKDDLLLPSGLIGPVEFKVFKIVKVK